jgi:hypothetical protein
MSAQRDAIHDTEEFGPGLIVYRVRWSLQEAAPQIPRVATPTASVAGGQVTLSCPTAGAQLYYGVRQFPGPGNPYAVLYAGPFPAPPAGSLLRAAAYAPNMFRSSTIATQF